MIGLNICVHTLPVLQILMLKPNPSVMVFGGEAIQKQLSHGVGAFVMGLVTL